MTEVTGGMTAATGVADPGCCGDSSMRARTSKPTTPTPLSRAMRVHGAVTSMNRRLAAITSLVLLAASVVLAVVVGVQRFPRGLTVLACLVAALLAAWWALVHRGAAPLRRRRGRRGAARRRGGAGRARGPRARGRVDPGGRSCSRSRPRAGCSPFTRRSRPRRRRSGRCCSTTRNRAAGRRSASRSRARLELAAWSRSSCTSAMTSRRSCTTRSTNGADAVGVAGGDGTQAIVAAIASEQGLPYVCVPAGTRNHFALDLGVDRDDVVGALDAFTKAGVPQKRGTRLA